MATSSDSRLILLLGGSGFIGIHIMLALHGTKVRHSATGQRYQVAIVDKKPPSPEAIRYAEERAGMSVLVFLADLEAEGPYPEMPCIPHCGIMLAALKNVNEAQDLPYRYIKTNIDLCVNSMKYLTELGVRRLIQASSSSVYHARSGRDGEPLGVYGYTKRVTEDICRRLMVNGRTLLVARYMNPIGSHPACRLFADIGICQKLSSMTPGEVLVNRGNCVRDYIHIQDLAAFHVDALEAWDITLFNEKDRGVVTLDVGTGIRITVEELIRAFGIPSDQVVNGERLNHEGYDTVGFSDEASRRIPQWWGRQKRSLATSLLDYHSLHLNTSETGSLNPI